MDLFKPVKKGRSRVKIIDTHCDVLYKLQQTKNLDFKNANTLQTNLKKLKSGNVKVQFFAIFLAPNTPSDKVWEKTLKQINLFHSEILTKNPEMIHIKKWKQINKLKTHEIGAVLTLEGAESFGNDVQKLQQLYKAGILSIGLTWNKANLCADGVGEPRGAGLTILGREVVMRNNKQQVLTDVSHLSEKGFWEVIELAHYPIASHSNTKKICNHPRNLSDEQIKALIEKDSQIHLVFYPPFIKEETKEVNIRNVIEHIDHICSLGGEKNIGFGSDFDGIDHHVKDLEDASKYQNLINELLKYYSVEQVHRFAYDNFINYLLKI